MMQQGVVEECRRRRIGGIEPVALIALCGPFGSGQIHADLLRQHFQRLAKGEVLLAHDKRKDVAARPARAKTMPCTCMGKDHKTWCTLAVERAESLVHAPGPFERSVAGDQLDNIHPLFDFIRDAADHTHFCAPSPRQTLCL
jgi:hypothetical protein